MIENNFLTKIVCNHVFLKFNFKILFHKLTLLARRVYRFKYLFKIQVVTTDFFSNVISICSSRFFWFWNLFRTVSLLFLIYFQTLQLRIRPRSKPRSREKNENVAPVALHFTRVKIIGWDKWKSIRWKI